MLVLNLLVSILSQFNSKEFNPCLPFVVWQLDQFTFTQVIVLTSEKCFFLAPFDPQFFYDSSHIPKINHSLLFVVCPLWYNFIKTITLILKLLTTTRTAWYNTKTTYFYAANFLSYSSYSPKIKCPWTTKTKPYANNITITFLHIIRL